MNPKPHPAAPLPTPSRALRTTLLCLLVAGLAGCANLYLHSPTRQQQAEAASKAWTEVAPGSLFTTERENLASLAQAEQQTTLRVAAAIGDHLATVITAPLFEGQSPEAKKARTLAFTVLLPTQQAMVKLAGPVAGFEARLKAGRELAPKQDNIARLAIRLQAKDAPLVGCSDLGAGPDWPEPAQAWLSGLQPASRASANSDLRRLQQDCADLARIEAKQLDAGIGAMPPGELRTAVDRRNRDQAAVLAQQEYFKLAKPGYDQALAAHALAEAQAQAPAADATLAAKLAKAASTLQDQVQLLSKLNNALADTFIADEKLAAIDSALASIASGQVADDSSKAVVLVVQAPALVDRYRAAMAASRKPLVLPLLIQRNALQLQRDAAAQDVALLQAKLDLSTLIVAAVNAEAQALRRALIELDQAALLQPGVMDLDWADALSGGNVRARQLLLSGTARYLDAVTRVQGERYRLEYARNALDHQRGLAYAESSVAQWANLIGAGVGQLDAFAKGGIDQAVLTDLAKTLGVLWIGLGVNK